MTDLFSNSTEFIEKTADFLKNPVVGKMFGNFSTWISDLLSRNKKAKQQMQKAKQENSLAALNANMEFMEQWNNEMQAELEQKAEEIDDFAKKAGLDLSGAKIDKSIVGSTFDGQIQGGIKIGDNNMESYLENKFDFDKLIGVIKMLKANIDLKTIEKMSTFDAAILNKLSEAIK